MSNSWFRLYHEFATDPKIQMLSEANQRRYIMILCLRCCNGDVTLQDDEVAFQMRISNEDWADTKSILIGKNLIDEDNNPVAWDKRQYASDSSRERVSKHRAKKKIECNVTVTPPDTDTDTDTDTEKKEKNIKKENSDNPKNLIPDVDDRVAEDFLKLRKQKKAPLTKTAVDGIRREAMMAGISLQDALIECCSRGWQGFKAAWYENAQKSPNARGSPKSLVSNGVKKQSTDEARRMLFGEHKHEEKDVTDEARAL